MALSIDRGDACDWAHGMPPYLVWSPLTMTPIVFASRSTLPSSATPRIISMSSCTPHQAKVLPSIASAHRRRGQAFMMMMWAVRRACEWAGLEIHDSIPPKADTGHDLMS